MHSSWTGRELAQIRWQCVARMCSSSNIYDRIIEKHTFLKRIFIELAMRTHLIFWHLVRSTECCVYASPTNSDAEVIFRKFILLSSAIILLTLKRTSPLPEERHGSRKLRFHPTTKARFCDKFICPRNRSGAILSWKSFSRSKQTAAFAVLNTCVVHSQVIFWALHGKHHWLFSRARKDFLSILIAPRKTESFSWGDLCCVVSRIHPSRTPTPTIYTRRVTEHGRRRLWWTTVLVMCTHRSSHLLYV